jgi:hypothetical protein
MLFVHPMWDNENQRLGLKACTPFGYLVRSAADLIGFFGLILLLVTPFYMLYRSSTHHFSWRLCWLFFMAFALGVFGRVLYEISWRVAVKKQFQYDYESRTARWIEGEHTQLFPKA